MSLKTELSEKLNNIAENPKNEFERIISDNKSCLLNMDEDQLSDVYMLRRRAEHLCRIIPYKRKELEFLVFCGGVGNDSKVVELFDCFNTLDFIFAKAKGEKF